MKRFVLLGSAVVVLNEFEDMTKAGKPYTEDDWNPVTPGYAIENKNIVAGYNAPDIIIGPMLQYVPGPKSINETNMYAIYNFLNDTYQSIDSVQFPFYHFVDVRDVANAHILALTGPSASNRRIILVSGLISPQLVINTIRPHFPELKDRIIEGNSEQLLPSNVDPTGWDTTRSYELFGAKWGYIGLEKSIADTVQNILEHEKAWGGNASD
ncbi:hypothetical protein CC78DRAFT_579812 [Lojkania enalia]|uniref:NAD-dependent epimerase/dehydratase domain-containing protein n=1 Tax=Lojkania enalia TaxID=147567 RepID=A0A9P4N8J5_9PLEO|nr:hypothetical protein CC78DRAFT_579812 [Didymosphaeria enalia]